MQLGDLFDLSLIGRRDSIGLEYDAPDGVRANGTPTNVDSFAKAFDCKAGDAMVNSGEKKVVIW